MKNIERIMTGAIIKQIIDEMDDMILDKMLNGNLSKIKYLKQYKTDFYNCFLKDYKKVENI